MSVLRTLRRSVARATGAAPASIHSHPRRAAPLRRGWRDSTVRARLRSAVARAALAHAPPAPVAPAAPPRSVLARAAAAVRRAFRSIRGR